MALHPPDRKHIMMGFHESILLINVPKFAGIQVRVGVWFVQSWCALKELPKHSCILREDAEEIYAYKG